MFRDTVRALLERECPPEEVRKAWDSDTGRSPERWRKLAEVGALGMLVPEKYGGLGMNEIDLVLPLEETGRAVLPEPVVETAAVGVPLLAESGAEELCAELLPRVAAGEAVITVGLGLDPCVADAHVAEILLLAAGGAELHALPRSEVRIHRQPCLDGARRLWTVDWEPCSRTRIAAGDKAARLIAAAIDRGAVAAAAQLVGIGQKLIDLAVAYARQREQFGRPIGSFQAVKHMLASAQVRVEFARPAIYRAAHAIARDEPERALAASHAKHAAGQAALQAARTALQVHGAIGYTWEVDLHLWMKRAWALEASWGSGPWHRRRVGERILDGATPPPAFGFEPPGGCG